MLCRLAMFWRLRRHLRIHLRERLQREGLVQEAVQP